MSDPPLDGERNVVQVVGSGANDQLEGETKVSHFLASILIKTQLDKEKPVGNADNTLPNAAQAVSGPSKPVASDANFAAHNQQNIVDGDILKYVGLVPAPKGSYESFRQLEWSDIVWPLRQMIVLESKEEYTLEFAGGPNKKRDSVRFVIVNAVTDDSKLIGFKDSDWAKMLMKLVKEGKAKMIETSLTKDDFLDAIRSLDGCTVDHIKRKILHGTMDIAPILKKRKKCRVKGEDDDDDDSPQEDIQPSKKQRGRPGAKTRKQSASVNVESSDEETLPQSTTRLKTNPRPPTMNIRCKQLLEEKEAQAKMLAEKDDELNRLKYKMSEISNIQTSSNAFPSINNNAQMQIAPITMSNYTANQFNPMMMPMMQSSQANGNLTQFIAKQNYDMGMVAFTSMCQGQMNAFLFNFGHK